MAIDNNALLRSSAALSANELTPASVDMGADITAQTYFVFVPSGVTGTSPTLDVVIQESDDNATWRNFLSLTPQMTTNGIQRATGQSNSRYRRYTATLSGTTPNFGVTLIGVEPAGRYNQW